MNHYYEVAPPPYHYFSGDNMTFMIVIGIAASVVIFLTLLSRFLDRKRENPDITVAQIEADSRIKVAELEAMAVTRRAEIEASCGSGTHAATEIG